jgi:hypothetical protein
MITNIHFQHVLGGDVASLLGFLRKTVYKAMDLNGATSLDVAAVNAQEAVPIADRSEQLKELHAQARDYLIGAQLERSLTPQTLTG